MTLTSALLSAGLALAGPALGAAVPGPDTLVGPGIDVPFLSQGPLTCGGAAAAMVERFWGARGVYAEDFASLVRPREGGIRTVDLAAALSGRGYQVEVYRGEPSRLPEALAAGEPVILLLDEGGATLHYVVAVGMAPDAVWVHDPAQGPARRIDRHVLLRRWARAEHWALVARPAAPSPMEGASMEGEAPEPPPARVARGIQELRTGDYEAARRTAGDVISAGERTDLGWRLLATARYLDGDRSGALDAWNALGEPRLDLIRIHGLHRTRFPVVERRASLRHGQVLTTPRLGLARRRIASLPALARTRLDYQPLPDGSVEAVVYVVERPLWPTHKLAVASLALDAIFDRTAELEAGPFLGAGDRWTFGASWDPALEVRRFGARSPAPPLPGIVSVTLDWRRGRFHLPSGPLGVEERLHAGIAMEEWVDERARLRGGIGLDRWEGVGRMGSASLRLLWMPQDRVRVDVSTEAWAGNGPRFGRAALRLGTRLPRAEHSEWRLDLGVAGTSSDAPALVWWGAGSGRASDVLLRGHPLVQDGAIGGAWGRGLMHASVEHVVFHGLGPLRIGGAVFADAARAWHTLTPDGEGLHVDVGAGLRMEVEGRTFRVDLARGGGAWNLSAQAGTWAP